MVAKGNVFKDDRCSGRGGDGVAKTDLRRETYIERQPLVNYTHFRGCPTTTTMGERINDLNLGNLTTR